MAIDLLILCLLVISFVVNLLALGAFWITPGLRTTANRFTINLLVVNLVGCLILAPTLFLCNSDRKGNAITEDGVAANGVLADGAAKFVASSDDSIEFYSKPGNHQLTIRHNGQLVEQEGVIVQYNSNSNNNNNNNNNNNHSNRRHEAGEAPATTGVEKSIEIFKRNATFLQALTIDERSNSIEITEIERQEEQDVEEPEPTISSFSASPSPAAAASLLEEDFVGATRTRKSLPLLPIGGGIRCWSIDLAAALGALAVLLVVGDTWCAVTDPLRYHTRISGVRTWVFIALIWAVGIFFGALSSLRELDFETGELLNKQRRFISAYSHSYFGPIVANGIFGIVFASLYFVVIILLPFGFVCGMYWRIFSEARENGLRMRQNGSSPLLQSALNLTHHHHQQSTGSMVAPLQYANSLCVHRNSISSTSSHGGGSGCGGLQMQIDTRGKNSSPAHLRRDSAAKVLLPTISDDGGSEEASTPSANEHQEHQHQLQHHQSHQGQSEQHHLDVTGDRNQNILLTLQAASGEIKRNYSARQLPLLGTSSQDLCEQGRLPGMRQVHSSPNLQRYTQSLDDNDSLSDDAACSPHLLGHHQHHMHASAHARRFHQLQHNHQHHRSLPQGSSAHPLQHMTPAHQALQIPSITASPKALSYMSSLRHRLSNASSLFKYREESRAARISILVVIMFLVSYLPYGCLVLIQSNGGVAAQFPHSTQLAVFMILLGTLTSPVIFAYRNKRVRRGVKRFIGRDVARCREHSSGGGGGGGGCGGSLQRQGSNSVKQHGGGSGANIRRNGSKLSTYSTNSCKYLTPQSSLVGNGSASLHTLALRPHHTIINFCSLPAKHDGSGGVVSDVHDVDGDEEASIMAGLPTTEATNLTETTAPASRPRPILQRGITIVEQIPIGGCGQPAHNNNAATTPNHKFNARHSLFKMFFQSSKNLSCAAAQACNHSAMRSAEPTEV